MAALVEGNSIRATARMTDVSKPTSPQAPSRPRAGLHAVPGRASAEPAVPSHSVRRDLGSSVTPRQKNVARAKAAPEGAGDVWTWVAIDADTKLIPSWLVGDRGLGSAYTLMHDLAERVAHRIQLTTDGQQGLSRSRREARSTWRSATRCSKRSTGPILTRPGDTAPPQFADAPLTS